MSNIVFTPKWNLSINQVEVYEPITGGANGNANLATRQLAENIFYLRDEVSALSVEINDTNKKFDTGIASVKDYADTKKSEAILDANTYADTKDVNNLKSAKDYTDFQNTINLNSAKSYSDTQKTEAIASSNSYSDTKKTEAIATAKDYADIADNTVEQYAREQDVINLNSAKSYADTKKTEAIASSNSYADTKKIEAISSSNSYADTKKTEAITAANAYTDQKQSISTYNPVFSSLTGVTSITGSNITYIRTDKMVKIFGTLTANIATAGNFSFKMSLPITSNFTNENQAGGSFLSEDSINGYIKSGTDKLLTVVANAKIAGGTLVAGINITYIII